MVGDINPTRILKNVVIVRCSEFRDSLENMFSDPKRPWVEDIRIRIPTCYGLILVKVKYYESCYDSFRSRSETRDILVIQ